MADEVLRTWREVLASISTLHVVEGSPRVCETVARRIGRETSPRARLELLAPRSRPTPSSLFVGLGRVAKGATMEISCDRQGRVRLQASRASCLFLLGSHVAEELLGEVAGDRVRIAPPFQDQRPVWDLYFGQAGRTVRGLDPESYVEEMARVGFTHLEVNALAAADPLEAGVSGEVYPRFYTYGPALDQFVASTLNRGVYPAKWLAANRRRLRLGCRLARKYGLTPSLTCFEPRSVPDAFLARYPELRGARVDHPFRSFKPRFNLAVSHPVVREHYRELVRNLLTEAPDLDHLSVWSNDSGAGFEFTPSLYAGANGSAYVVREWKGPDAVARAAADNVTAFLRLLRDTATEIRPGFRVATRLEPFGPERDAVLAGLGDGLDVEVPTLLRTGWDSPYGHPRYPECGIGPFTTYNDRFDDDERTPLEALRARDCRTHVLYAHGPVNNFEPLLHVPTPWLTHAKLQSMRDVSVRHLAHFGGIAPPASVLFDVNAEVFRSFQLDADRPVEDVLVALARRWAGSAHYRLLVKAWRFCERAVRGFMPHPLYFSWGVWYRILIRPLVPDIDRIPERERRYYERHLLATHHNPNRVDLARDALWELVTPATAKKAATRLVRSALPPLDRIIGLLADAEADAPPVLIDLLDRLRALRCWMTTHGHVHSWIADVHGYTAGGARAAACRDRLRAMITREIANARAFRDLLAEGRTEVLALSSVGETTFIYDRELPRHLDRKVELMRRHRRDVPRIAEDLIWRVRKLGEERGT